ncbi:pseudaminic acid cytidylyltransferase, partial [Acinetobacter baumannii]|nr:pseudaminic acid cytidylyltransferase [Acinetobacter baumannii]
IEAALKSECFAEVWVSTDDQEIADIAVKFGAKVPFLRPAHLSDDYATTADVMQHATQAFAQLQGQSPDLVCCLYATAPFVQVDDLKTGLQLLQSHPLDYAFSATTFAF